MIPISDSNPTRRVPWVTVGLIVVNIVVFPLWEPALRSRNQETYFYCNALVPYEVTHQTNLAEGGADARAALAEDYGKKDAAALQRDLQRRCPNKDWALALLVSCSCTAGGCTSAGTCSTCGSSGTTSRIDWGGRTSAST